MTKLCEDDIFFESTPFCNFAFHRVYYLGGQDYQ